MTRLFKCINIDLKGAVAHYLSLNFAQYFCPYIQDNSKLNFVINSLLLINILIFNRLHEFIKGKFNAK